ARLQVMQRLPPTTSASSIPTVKLTGAIFADKTFVGDQQWAERVFQFRAAKLTAWTGVVQELEQLYQPGGPSVDALTTAISHLDSGLRDDAGDSIRKATQTNIRLLMDDARKDPSTVRSHLELLLTLARSSERAAAAHVR